MAEELIVLERADALVAFNDEKAFEELYQAIKEKADAFEPDISNAKGRKELASFAHKITKTKTRIDGVRGELTEEMRMQVAAIDRRGRVMRERLDALRDEVRQPLTDWETAEKARVENIRAAIDNARSLGQVKFGETSEQIQERINKLPAHDMEWYGEFQDEAQLVIENAFNSLTLAKTAAVNAEQEAAARAKEREELDRLRKEAEERAAKEAAAEADRKAKEAAAEAARKAEEDRKAQAAREAEQKIADERAAMERQQQEMQRQLDDANRKAAEAQRAAEEAQEKAAAAAEAERRRIEEERAEEQRKAEEDKRIEAERKRRAKAAADRIAVSKAKAVQALFPFIQSADVAAQIIDAIEMGTIPHLKFEA